MATLTLTVTSGLGTDASTLTFSSADATRIFNAYKNKINPAGTQADLVVWMAGMAKQEIVRLVMGSERQ